MELDASRRYVLAPVFQPGQIEKISMTSVIATARGSVEGHLADHLDRPWSISPRTRSPAS
jgi:hypothetical protein